MEEVNVTPITISLCNRKAHPNKKALIIERSKGHSYQ